MSESAPIAVIIALTLMAFRCFGPVFLVFAIGYAMKPLMDRLQGQEEVLAKSTQESALGHMHRSE